MKKTKEVTLVLAAVLNFSIFAFFFLFGILMKIETTANNLATNYALELEQPVEAIRATIDGVASFLLVFGIISGIYGFYVLYARKQSKPLFYVIGIGVGLLKLDILSIVGYITGYIAYRNGDELSY